MIETERLVLRGWRPGDVALHNAMMNDAVFMRHLGPALPLAQSEAAAARQIAYAASYGSCFWAVEHKESGRFIGYCGIKPGPDGTPIAGLPEIGWGIAREHWRRGYAVEGAAACLARAWRTTDWSGVVAITAVVNMPSRGVMDRLGMTHDAAGDFDHPALAPGDPLRRHVLYRIARPG